jgi:hypothetical protein
MFSTFIISIRGGNKFMRRRMVLLVMLLSAATQVWGADNLTGMYVTNQENLTGTMKIKQIDSIVRLGLCIVL